MQGGNEGVFHERIQKDSLDNILRLGDARIFSLRVESRVLAKASSGR